MIRLLSIAAAVVCVVSPWLTVEARGGGLAPPGAPGPTMKTLEEVEPRIAINAANTPGDASTLYRISQPGSYYLTGNVTGVAGKIGITISVPGGGPGVTIDLCGFELAGVPGSDTGIYVETPGLRSLSIRNGVVRSWGNSGVFANLATSGHYADLRIESNAADGLVTGQNTTIEDCVTSFNGGFGVFAAFNTMATGVRANGNGESGILINGEAGSVTNCSASQNAKSGFSLSFGARATDCTAAYNTISGFSFVAGGAATNCLAMNNQSHGFVGTDDIRLNNCTARNNFGRGFSMGEGPLITDCIAKGNTLEGIRITSGGQVSGCRVDSNFDDGIRILQGGQIRDTVVERNIGDGIHAGPDVPANVAGVTISGCRVSQNGGHGIRVFMESTVTGNTCSSNQTGSGIRAENVLNTIADNAVLNCDIGIEVLGSANTIVRNVCRNNSPNFSIVAGNTTGAIAVNEAAMNAATNGLVNLSQ